MEEFCVSLQGERDEAANAKELWLSLRSEPRSAGRRGVLLSGFGLPFTSASVYKGRVSEVTRMLEAIQQGDPKAAEELLPLVYDELRRLAEHKMASEDHQKVLVWDLRLIRQELRALGLDWD